MDEQSEINLKALIVDDDPMICEFLRAFTEHEGFETVTLSEPERFDSVYRDDFHLIFLDLNMPNVDGIEVIRYLGEKESRAGIVLVSAEEKGVLRAAQGLAVSQRLTVLDVLDKPINQDQLTDVIRNFRNTTLAKPQIASADDTLNQRGSPELPSLAEMRVAMEHNDFDVYFQPKIHLDDNGFAGIEALARWTHSEKGIIPPDYFILFAERYDLILSLTEILLRKTCDYINQWPKVMEPYQVSVNVSELCLGVLEFPEMMTRVLEEAGIYPSRIILEITETTVSTNPTTALDVLTRLRLRGFKLSIDDFGTGHSSLARLQQFPFSELKIDKSFVGDSDINHDSRMIVKSTIELARRLDLTVVAEGAEKPEHIELLKQFGCDTVQGYFFSKPLPNDRFLIWLGVWLEDT